MSHQGNNAMARYVRILESANMFFTDFFFYSLTPRPVVLVEKPKSHWLLVEMCGTIMKARYLLNMLPAFTCSQPFPLDSSKGKQGQALQMFVIES